MPVKIVVPNDRPLQTYFLLMIMNGASTFGRLAFAAFGDQLGALNMHIVTQIICAILIFVLWTLASTTAAAIAFCVLFGIFSGTVIGLPPASMGNILNCTYNTPSTKHIGHAKLGQWTGMMYSAAAIPSLVGPLLAGHLVSQYRTYLTVQMWSAANLLLSAVCMVIARWYLPCYDGESFRTKALSLFGKQTESSEKRRKESAATDSDTSNLGINMSPSTTRVNSQAPSRQHSDEKIDRIPSPLG